MTDDEVWRPIPGYDGYHASSRGRVRNARLGHVLTGTRRKNGYRQVGVRRRRRRVTAYVHRLVALAFFGVPQAGFVTNHLNGIKHDNRVENLEFTTPRRNVQHAVALGLLRPPVLLGERNPGAKLTPDNVRAIRAMRRAGWGLRHIGRAFGVTPSAVSRVALRKDWRHVA